jgi:hypothetical protein
MLATMKGGAAKLRDRLVGGIDVVKMAGAGASRFPLAPQ